MQIGVSSYSFTGAVRSGRLAFGDIPARAKALGFEIIEFAGLEVPDGRAAIDVAREVRDECARVGIAVGNYTIAADFINGIGGPPEHEVERLRGELDVAVALGSPGMRHDATWKFRGTFDQALPRLAAGCRAVTEIGATLGVRTMVENHGFFAQDSDRMERLVAAVDHENFGLLVDVGNFLCVDEDPALAVGRVAPFAAHAHVKDFHVRGGERPASGQGWFRTRGGNYLRGAVLGHGEVPVAQCLGILSRAGYDGVVSIEFEGIEDPELALGYGIENLRRYLADLA